MKIEDLKNNIKKFDIIVEEITDNTPLPWWCTINEDTL